MSMENGSILDQALARISKTLDNHEASIEFKEIGHVTTISNGIVKVSGLPYAGYEELLKFPNNLLGIAFNVDAEEIGVVLLGDFAQLKSGDEVLRTGRVIDVPVGDCLLGRVIDPLGKPLDNGGALHYSYRLPIERQATHIMDRAPVSTPLQTGLKVIDALIPVGRGQRELIMGDRQTGKTTIALHAILNQKDQNVICVYCTIGQRGSNVASVIETLREAGALDYTVVVVSEGSDPPGLNFIAPLCCNQYW